MWLAQHAVARSVWCTVLVRGNISAVGVAYSMSTDALCEAVNLKFKKTFVLITKSTADINDSE